MTSIQRPGGPAGPGGPGGPDEPDALTGPDASAAATGGDPTAALASAIDSGQLAPGDALAQMIDSTVAGLPPEQAAELRAMLAEAMRDDPYLAGLARDLGAPADPGGGE